jgi:hypothetical protein
VRFRDTLLECAHCAESTVVARDWNRLGWCECVVPPRPFACLNCIADSQHEPGARSVRELQDQMGHASLETTSLYLSDVASYLQRGAPRVGMTELVKRLTA